MVIVMASKVTIPYTIAWSNNAFIITWANTYPSICFSSSSYTMVATTGNLYNFGNDTLLTTLDWTKETSLGATSFSNLQAIVAALVINGGGSGGNLTPTTVVVEGTANATSTTTGSLQTQGGLGVAGNIYGGQALVVAGNIQCNQPQTVGSSSAWNVNTASVATLNLPVIGAARNYYLPAGNNGSQAIITNDSAAQTINGQLTVDGALTLPSLTANEVLTTNGSNNVTSTALTNGQLLIGSTGVAPVATTLTGTTNQVNVTNGAGSITLSTPQNIHTTATPTFKEIFLQENPVVSYVNPNLGSRCVATKYQPLTNGVWTSMQSLTPGTPGKITKLWLATAMNNSAGSYANIWIAIVFDGAASPQVGGSFPSSPSNSNAISLEVLYGNGEGLVNINTTSTLDSIYYNPIYSLENFGFQPGGSSGASANVQNTVGWIAGFDMPFQTSYNIYLYNSNSSSVGVDMYIQTFWEALDYTPSPFYYCYITPYVTASTSYPNSITLFSQSSPTNNGVAWVGGRMFYLVCSSSWYEGQITITSGGTTIFQSTGTEDFYGSGYTWAFGIFHNNLYGCLYAYPGSNATFGVYRFFEKGKYPSATGSNTLTVTQPVGSSISGQSGTISNIVGINVYYM